MTFDVASFKKTNPLLRWRNANTIVVTNRIHVASGHDNDSEDRLRNRVHPASQCAGFVRDEAHRLRPVHFDRNSEETAYHPTSNHLSTA